MVHFFKNMIQWKEESWHVMSKQCGDSCQHADDAVNAFWKFSCSILWP